MKQLFVFLVITTLVASSCLKNDSDKRSLEYFNNHLKKDMNFIDIKQKFGVPDEEKGSGIHIYVYKLKD